MIFEQITEELLNEKLITYANRAPYGQVVFIAGGSASGKGYAIKNFIDSASFKIRDVDETKKQIQKLNALGKISIDDIIKKFGRNLTQKDIDLINKIKDSGYSLSTMDLRNPDHVKSLHAMVKAMGIKDSSLITLLKAQSNPDILPNIMFDITAKDITDITSVIPMLVSVGYRAKNIHLTWVLTKYDVAIEQNKTRSRVVPEDIVLSTHEGAANTVWGIVTKALPRGMDGRVDVVLNNRENTVYWKVGDNEDDFIVKGFLSLPLKKAGAGFFAESVWKNILYKWILENAPSSVTANMTEHHSIKLVKLLNKLR